jgi:hypothetical protein
MNSACVSTVRRFPNTPIGTGGNWRQLSLHFVNSDV